MSRVAYITNNTGGKNRVIAALHVEMNDAGVTPRDVADGIGMSQHKFDKRMSGATPFYVCELAAICMFLNAPLGKILAVP